MSYGKRVQLDTLFDPRQPMSTVQSLEIQLTPVVNNGQETVNRLLSKTFSGSFSFSRNRIQFNFQRHLPSILI